MIKKYTYKKKNYRSLIKVILPSLLFLVVLFSLFSISNNTKVITSLAKVFYGDNEIELDNWEISTVFYDSTVNNGNTPLTEINWDASSLDYDQTETRVITIQINYKNTNTVTSYAIGELEISIPVLDVNEGASQCLITTNVGANDANHTGYDWKVKSVNSQHYVFTNDVQIDEKANLEGSIQIEYTIMSEKESKSRNTYSHSWPVEFKEDSCTHSRNIILNAKLNNTISSNELTYNYTRTYNHPWSYYPYELKKTASKILSYDRLGENADDYIWVRYSFSFDKDNTGHSWVIPEHWYPYVYPKTNSFKIYDDEIPNGCKVIDHEGNLIEKTGNRFVFNISESMFRDFGNTVNYYAYVGYPKSNYDETNMDIHNHAYLAGTYYGKNEEDILAEADISLNLQDFDFTYTGNLYAINKTWNSTDVVQNHYYEAYIGKDPILQKAATARIGASARYSGRPMDVKIGDDVLFITGQDGKYRKLEDGEYRFTTASIPTLKNANGQTFQASKYDGELWVRYSGKTEYEYYGKAGYTYFKDDEDVVGFYFVLKDVTESVMVSSNSSSEAMISSFVIYNSNEENTAESGQVANFDYIQVFINGEIQNIPALNSYTTTVSRELISNFDLETYGHYVQRGVATYRYSSYTAPEMKYTISVEKRMHPFVQDARNEKFWSDADVQISTNGARLLDRHVFDTYYISENKELKTIKGWNIYDLLPKGVSLESSEEEILSSAVIGGYHIDYPKNIYLNKYYFISDINGKYLSNDEVLELIKNNTTIEIIHNYHNTGRTYIHLITDLSSHPIIAINDQENNGYNQPFGLVKYNYQYSISYDSYLEYGEVYKNRAYADFLYDGIDNENYFCGKINNFDANWAPNDIYKDSGYYDNVESDIDNDGITNEFISVEQSTQTVSSIISTHQDIQVSVQNNLGNYETGKVNISNNSEYKYKLRARTGTNDVTNLVIYDSLENYAKDPNMEFIDSSKGYHKWKGEFLGIDTSYAESKGYTIRTYYSESDQPGSIKDDDSWVLYTDSVDKTKVKSLAFEYLDNEGNPAVLPANSLTYVLIRMKSPNDENLKTLAYNGCWTDWNAIDSITGRPVDFITGINSNIVKVALPNSVEPQDIDLEINKYWNDSNNKLGIRPNTTTIQVVPDEDLTKAIDIPLGEANVVSNNSNHWKTTISVPKYDLDGNTINYSFRENEIVLDNNYKYTPEVNDNSITNTLMKEIELKKIWKDNTNAYLTRPSNVTYKIKQNNNLYREVTFTGDYSTNEWTKKIAVPVFDNSNKEYTYTMEEESINNYISDCNEFICTNTLSTNDTLNIKKNWIDNNNSYNTRPSSIMINVLQNNTTYRGITLTSNNNWTNTITVPKYDSNGVKYNYTIEEDQVNEYDLVEYNQSTYNITNTLKTNINLTIKKNWVDDNNSNNTRPNELKITLLQNDNEYRELTLTGNTNTWTTSIEVPKYDNNQNKYTYSIREKIDNVNSDYSDITYSEEELSVTNKLNKKQNLLIKKKWMDDDNKYLTRPSSVKVNLLRDNELFKTIELEGDSNIWSTTINDIDIYDSNGRKYNYTLEEETLEKYGKVTYNNADLEITNELTEIPKVTLYFTVVNGYVDPKTGEMKYDDFGLNEIMKQYNVNPNDEYIFKFELKNTETGKIYEGKLSTQGVLEFDDIPYGEYKAVEGDDKLFKFVDMLEIEEVNGVKFERRGKEGFITIEPTGQNIMYGAKIINKIEAPITNPKTSAKGLFLLLTILIITIISFIFIKKKKELYN